MDTKVDAYIERSTAWPAELRAAQSVLLGCALTEQIKWGKPCYSYDGANIVILQEMKAFLSLMFFKGALLDDPDGVLHEQGPSSRSAKRMQLTSVEEIIDLTAVIAAYVAEAIRVEQASTRLARIDKYAPKILAGKGLRD